jgi:hypothetical protein
MKPWIEKKRNPGRKKPSDFDKHHKFRQLLQVHILGNQSF